MVRLGLSAARRRRADARQALAVLAAQSKALNQLLVAGIVLALEIIEQAPPLPDHDKKAAARMEILLVRLQMLGQIVDALAEDGDLHLRRACIVGFLSVLLDDRLLAFRGNRHRLSSSF